ncbi:hypothetical protein G6F59_015904 [Rhizopus arrhizus]|nr:hypothetical protein G6F59_015904 [Rhizopus arrhizus]
MVALAGPLGDFHVAQQRVHLWNGQAPIGTHRAMAGHGRQQFVARTRHAPALAVFAQVGQHVAQQPFRLGMRQQRRNAAHMQRTGAGTGHFEAERGQRFGFAFSGVGLALAHGKGDRHQQRLRLQADAIMRVLQALVADALVRRMHPNGGTPASALVTGSPFSLGIGGSVAPRSAPDGAAYNAA